MRVTNSMMADGVIFNLQRSLRRFVDLQTQMSSGRRINKPSDDPVGTLRDLDYRTELSKISQFQANNDQGMNWLNSYDSILADVKDLLSNAKETAIAMASDNYDADQRRAAANEVQAIFDRIVQLADSTLGGRQMFSGHKTQTSPLSVYGHGVTYRGDDGRILYEIESSNRETVNLTGAETFLKTTSVLGSDADLNVGVTNATLLTNLNDGAGIDLGTGTFTITDLNQAGASVTVDLNAAPPATTVGEVITRINDTLTAAGMDGAVQVRLSDDGNSLLLDVTQTGLISNNTQISKLNDGSGLGTSEGVIRVTDGAGIDINMDFSSVETIGEVMTIFNLTMAGRGYPNVSMGINAAGTGLEITDTNVPPLGLTIENVSDEDQTAAALGIEGYVGASLVGRDLQPQPSIEISDTTGTTAADLGLLGEFGVDSSGEDLNPRLAVSDNLADLRNRIGLDGERFTIWQGERSLTIDFNDPTLVTVQDFLDRINNSSLNIAASLNESGHGIQIENNDRYRSLVIQDLDGGRATKQMGLYGSSDMMGSLMVLIDALKNDDQEGIGSLLDNFDDAMDQALEVRSGVGTKTIMFETSYNRLTNLELNFTDLLAEVEDADLTKVVTELATRENNYQAALASAGKIIQPSLLDFLR